MACDQQPDTNPMMHQVPNSCLTTVRTVHCCDKRLSRRFHKGTERWFARIIISVVTGAGPRGRRARILGDRACDRRPFLAPFRVATMIDSDF